MTPLPPPPTLFPYTTLFRSGAPQLEAVEGLGVGAQDLIEGLGADLASGLEVAQRLDLGGRIVMSIIGADDQDITIRSEEHTSELQSRFDLVCRLLLEKKKNN